MDFGAVLDEWDKMQKAAKRKGHGGNSVSGKKANAPEKGKESSDCSGEENGFSKRGFAATASSIKIRSHLWKRNAIANVRSST